MQNKKKLGQDISVGQVMKKTGGTANPANVTEIIETTLDKLKSI